MSTRDIHIRNEEIPTNERECCFELNEDERQKLIYITDHLLANNKISRNGLLAVTTEMLRREYRGQVNTRYCFTDDCAEDFFKEISLAFIMKINCPQNLKDTLAMI